ncbi:hypothetical protein CAC42_2344 [Sphaceloma murrayae]|uniref:CTP-dependent diacylglycerol kinase 1 n=1 Tax=Sphaceloma murrayae TaxID=2082308 RepID=A0A2K1QIX4_9PEZI|nr:hypothetical protein CAC42_2344 [Sphaceloma murrayae]
MSASQYPIPPTPRVISPSPTPSEKSGKDGYFSQAASARLSSPEPISEDGENNDPELSRARSRSRSPALAKRGSARLDGMTPIAEKSDQSTGSTKPTRRKPQVVGKKASSNGLLKPSTGGYGRDFWRELSRSPSPFGLIPIHREWRTFVHKHEIPRKVLHVSIGFLTLALYRVGKQSSDIHPVLLTLLIPIALVDVARMNYAPFNGIYIKVLGAFMRESEAHDKYNGVISYLAGAWAVMYFCPKDVAVISILLLSWCDTAASTFGRLYGRYTPRIRKGKSLAGSLAAFIVGVGAASLFYLVFEPMVPEAWNSGINRFAFDGHLTLPFTLQKQLGLSRAESTITGGLALAVVSVVSGLVASVSEAIDFFGFDDNLTIPIFAGLGLGAFFKAFQ